jgi:lipopolysaccharide/colanic/teichoic acid biosynthesis glycosyltransferase
MLLPDNIHPEDSIYYNGTIVLHALRKQKIQHLLDLYQMVKQQRDMTFSVFVLCLDWLFLINVAVLNDKGEVELCS